MSEIFNTNNDSGDYNITKFPVGKTFDVKIDDNTVWVKDILLELNQDADEKNPQQYLEETSIELELEIVKKFKNELSEYFLVTGEIHTRYKTKCVKTLKDMTMDLTVDLKACFIDLSLEDIDQFKDQTETFIDNDLYELYFYSERKITLKEVVSELIYLNLDQYPSLDASDDMEDLQTSLKQ